MWLCLGADHGAVSAGRTGDGLCAARCGDGEAKEGIDGTIGGGVAGFAVFSESSADAGLTGAAFAIGGASAGFGIDATLSDGGATVSGIADESLGAIAISATSAADAEICATLCTRAAGGIARAALLSAAKALEIAGATGAMAICAALLALPRLGAAVIARGAVSASAGVERTRTARGNALTAIIAECFAIEATGAGIHGAFASAKAGTTEIIAGISEATIGGFLAR